MFGPETISQSEVCELLKLWASASYQLHMVLLIANSGPRLEPPAPILKILNDEIQNPKPGDYVIEVSSFVRTDRDKSWSKAIGRFVIKKSEYEPFTGEGRADGFLDEFTYIELLDGSIQKWTNSRFVKILTRWTQSIPAHEQKRLALENAMWVQEALKRHNLIEASANDSTD